MGTILENLERIHAAVVLDKLRRLNTAAPDDNFGNDLGRAAVKAILGGIKSEEWKTYMSFFADNKAQLTLLTQPMDGEETYINESRAYIVSNVICGASTDTNVSYGVNRELGNGIAGGDDGTITKPFPIPDITI